MPVFRVKDYRPLKDGQHRVISMQATEPQEQTMQLETITPDYARELLSTNHNNRNVKARHVKRLADEVLANAWSVNGSAIVIGRDGTLLDGQHRCLAVVMANKPISTFVLRNADDSVKETIDCGVKRSANDVLSMRGYKNVNAMAAAIRTVWAYPNVSHRGSDGLSNREVREIADMYAEIIEPAVRFVGTKKAGWLPKRWTPASQQAAALIIAGDEAPLVKSFIADVSSGTGLTEGSPEIAFTRWSLRTSNSTSRAGASPAAHWIAFVKALNAYRYGTSVKLLRVAKEETAPLLFGIETNPFEDYQRAVIEHG